MAATEGVTCGDDYFFDFTNSAARDFYTSTALRLQDKRFDGYFFDDTEGLGTEHPHMIGTTGMTQAEVDAWNSARLPVYATMHSSLAKNGKFEWHMFRDADGEPPGTPGAKSVPTNTTCAAWMAKKCATSFEKVPLMMTFTNQFWDPQDRHQQQRPGVIKPEPYIFPWRRQQLAAFLLIRGPHAFVGTGWGVGLVHEWDDLYDMDLGVPAASEKGGTCRQTKPGVFERSWTKYHVELDCNSWEASFTQQPYSRRRGMTS
jgi:hypothetical protein